MSTPILFRGPESAANRKAHLEAAQYPKSGFERAIVTMVAALEEYAVNHQKRYESKIGMDGVLGAEWESIARGVLGLLNGECGRLDCGSVDSHIRTLAHFHGADLA